MVSLWHWMEALTACAVTRKESAYQEVPALLCGYWELTMIPTGYGERSPISQRRIENENKE